MVDIQKIIDAPFSKEAGVEIRKVAADPTIKPKRAVEPPIFIRFHGWFAGGYEIKQQETILYPHILKITYAPHSPRLVGIEQVYGDGDVLTKDECMKMVRDTKMKRKLKKKKPKETGFIMYGRKVLTTI